MTATQYLKDAGGTASDGQHDECWVPCSKGDPGAVLFFSEDIIAPLAREIHYNQHGPSAWATLTPTGHLHYYERTRNAINRAIQEE